MQKKLKKIKTENNFRLRLKRILCPIKYSVEMREKETKFRAVYQELCKRGYRIDQIKKIVRKEDDVDRMYNEMFKNSNLE